MIIHDTYLKQVEEILDNKGNEVDIIKNNWEMKTNSDYILDTDTVLELGATTVKSANLTLCTSQKSFEDKIVVIGKDIQNLKGKVENFAKVIIVSLKDDDNEDNVYKSIKSVTRARMGLNFKGTMLKSSFAEGLECFRVSKEAYKKGLNFSIMGSALIERLKSLDEVLNVQVYYIVDDKQLSSDLLVYQDKITKVTDAMNHVFEGLELDCGSCAIKEVCDEVDGMRDSHKKQINK